MDVSEKHCLILGWQYVALPFVVALLQNGMHSYRPTAACVCVCVCVCLCVRACACVWDVCVCVCACVCVKMKNYIFLCKWNRITYVK